MHISPRGRICAVQIEERRREIFVRTKTHLERDRMSPSVLETATRTEAEVVSMKRDATARSDSKGSRRTIPSTAL
jgi:hypothetical protein